MMKCQNKHCVQRVPVSQSFRNTPSKLECVCSPGANEEWRQCKGGAKPKASTGFYDITVHAIVSKANSPMFSALADL